MSKPKKKLSRKEREEQRQTRRLMIIGGGLAGLAAMAGVGVTMLDPSFPRMEGNETLDERIEKAGISRHILNLTPEVPNTDVMVIGTTDCSFCRDFVEGGLADMLAFAKQNRLGVSYAPIGNSSSSLASTRLLAGFARHSKAAPEKILRAAYAAGSAIASGEDVATAAAEHGKALGLSQRQIDKLLTEDQVETARLIQATTQAFPIEGTPMFFVASSALPGRINMFSGWMGKSSLRRQIEAARSV